MNGFNMLKVCPGMPRVARAFAETSACNTRVDRAREESERGERNCKGRKGGTRGALLQAAWIFILIIWTQLFHCK